MGTSVSLVDGPQFSAAASYILRKAWSAPALHYTTDYLAWQMTFPSTAAMPTVAAFDGGEPVGFAGTTARRVRSALTDFEVAIVSFVAVSPDRRGRGIARRLYSVLLRQLADRNVPVVTYAICDSPGDHLLRQSYPEAGFRVQPIGLYASYGYIDRLTEPNHEWTPRVGEASDAISVIQNVSRRSTDLCLWSAPGTREIAHYLKDPRPRKLVIAEKISTAETAAGFCVASEIRVRGRVERAITLDSVWIASADTNALLSLLKAAAGVWDNSSSTVIMCPNLSGFAGAALNAARIRRAGPVFSGYFCYRGQERWPEFSRTNLEIV